MSILKELAKEKLLENALRGCRAVLEKELDIPEVIFTMASNVRQEIVRRARDDKDSLKFPYAYLVMNSLAGIKDRQNNYAAQKHGNRFQVPGDRATTSKGYLFPITLGLELHYIDSDPVRVLTLAQALVLLSLTEGLTFQVNVGQMYSYAVRLEIPLETSINVTEGNAEELPNATEIVAQLVMHTQIGFFRNVSAVNGQPALMEVSVNGDTAFAVNN